MPGGAGSAEAGSGEANLDGESEGGATAAAPAGEGASMAAAAAGAGESGSTAQSGGDGVGKDPGGDPMGSRAPGAGTRGQAHEARVRSGAGPSRAEVIEAGAHKGFAETEYQRVFQDYSAVVEETLDTTAVPAARRYLVRRYFQLIRPREGRPDGTTGGVHGP
jgi:hypothetical protein